MYCFTLRLIAALVLLCGTAPALAQEKNYLTVRSQGYSRFEIENDNIVAYYTGGVEFTYMGFELRADDLRFNQATGVASIEGTVQFRSPSLDIDAAGVVLDAEQGLVEALGPLRVRIASVPGKPAPAAVLPDAQVAESKGLYAEAASAVATFTPGITVPRPEEISVELSGGLLLIDSSGNRLTTASATYDGAAGQLTVPGSFELFASLPQGSPQGLPSAPTARITGQSLIGSVDRETGALSAVITRPEILSSAATASAGMAIVSSSTAGELGRAWRIELQGEPVLLGFSNVGQRYDLDADGINATIDPGGNFVAQLTGHVQTMFNGAVIDTEGLSISSSQGKISLGNAEGFRIGFDLSQRIVMEPLDLSTLGLDRAIE